jgi:hypothetical protein
MASKSPRIGFYALFIGIVFLAVQFHFCADLTSGPSTSHICPICNAAGSALVTSIPGIAIIPVSNRLENLASPSQIFSDIPRGTSPRAPPSR